VCFGVIFDRYATVLLRYLVRRVGMDEADPMLGEVFRVAFERRSSLRPPLSLGEAKDRDGAQPPVCQGDRKTARR
jgi:hypothetical protein